MRRRRRVGIVDYLNSRPLAWGFSSGALAERYEAVYESPARVADLLSTGDVDIGLVPSIEYARIPGLLLLPGMCVASEKDVKSVLLVSRVPFSKIETLALDENSRTSATLVRILLKEMYGCEPRTAVARPDLERMLTASDAALIIGDPALRIDARREGVLDLASAWHELTGLPFVFAVWAVREESAEPGLAADFSASLAAGRERLAALAEDAGRELGLAAAYLRAYLEHSLSFELGVRERAGLEEFFRRAAPWVDGDFDASLRFVGGDGQ